MESIFVLIFLSSVGISEPEVGTPCEEALAAIQGPGLKIVDVDVIPGGILHTMVKPKPKYFKRGKNTKVALVECAEEKI